MSKSQSALKPRYYTSSVLYRNYGAYSRPTPLQLPAAKPASHFKPAALIVVALAALFGGHVFWSQHVSAEKLADSERATFVAAQMAAAQKTRINDLPSQINALINANSQENIGVATYSPINGFQTYGDTSQVDAASVGKLLTAADFLTQVQSGQTTLNHDIDDETAQQWLQAMIVDSDDTAWSELNGYLGDDGLTNYAANLGITYDSQANNLSPQDTVTLLQKLYGGQLLNNANRSLLLSYMRQANYRQYIVPAVPGGDMVYHKVGLDGDQVNDAAIITNGKSYMIVVIMTNGNGTYDWTDRAALMQQIAGDTIKAYL